MAHFRIGDRFFVTDGEHGSVEYLQSSIRYLAAENINNGFVDIASVRCVSEVVHKKNAGSSVDAGDVLIFIKVTLRQVAVAESWLPPCNMNRDVAILKPLSQTAAEECGFLALFVSYPTLKLPGFLSHRR
jgi:hypothetical protein